MYIYDSDIPINGIIIYYALSLMQEGIKCMGTTCTFIGGAQEFVVNLEIFWYKSRCGMSNDQHRILDKILWPLYSISKGDHDIHCICKCLCHNFTFHTLNGSRTFVELYRYYSLSVVP